MKTEAHIGLDAPHVLIIGAPTEKQTVVGPFDSFDSADTWISENCNALDFTWVVPIRAPTVEGAK